MDLEKYWQNYRRLHVVEPREELALRHAFATGAISFFFLSHEMLKPQTCNVDTYEKLGEDAVRFLRETEDRLPC